METRTKETADGLPGEPVRRLTVLYDERCAKCRRYAAWLGRQRFRVQVELLPAGSEAAGARYPHVVPWLGRELVVVDNEARAWIGPPAFVMCMWAMDRGRTASSIATWPVIGKVTNAFFRHLSNRPGTHRATGRDADWLSECDDQAACTGSESAFRADAGLDELWRET